ncbi:MAG TPA: hypothetical protein VMF91_07115 [Bryobacteraceae bacterium]|nr:hypothetical protein [Bryobacteraceae bacterium]
MFRIQRDFDGRTANFRLIGRIQFDSLPCIKKALQDGSARKRFDVSEVTLADAAVIRFLISCEDEGIEITHCPPWVREWMVRERAEGA